MPSLQIKRHVRNARDWLRYRILPKHKYHLVYTGLKPGYYDQDYRMLHACFMLLVDFAEEEFQTFGHEYESFEAMAEAHIQSLETQSHIWTGSPEGDPESPKIMQPHIDTDREILALYRWWKYERPAAYAQLETKSPKHYWKYEEELDATDQQMLHRLVEIRRKLWV